MLFLDTSAWLKRFLDELGNELVIRLMAEDPAWAFSAIARTEAEIALCALGSPQISRPCDRNWTTTGTEHT